MLSLFWDLVPWWLRLVLFWAIVGLVFTKLIDAMIWAFQHL